MGRKVVGNKGRISGWVLISQSLSPKAGGREAASVASELGIPLAAVQRAELALR